MEEVDFGENLQSATEKGQSAKDNLQFQFETEDGLDSSASRSRDDFGHIQNSKQDRRKIVTSLMT